MYEYLAQFPIVNENTPMSQLHDEALQETRALVLKLGYIIAGPPRFQVLDMPVGMHVECRVLVEELKFRDGRRGK